MYVCICMYMLYMNTYIYIYIVYKYIYREMRWGKTSLTKKVDESMIFPSTGTPDTLVHTCMYTHVNI